MSTDELIASFIRQRLSPWCKCICREYPDGSMCLICGHAHKSDRDKELKRELHKEQP